MNQTQLKGDLNEIEQGVNRADMPESVKRILRDMIEWNRGLVDQSSAMNERTDAIEDAVDELLHGAEEGISLETAKVILTALEQSRLVCVTVSTALEKSPFDELTTKRFNDLIKQCQQSLAVAMQTTQELVMPDEPEQGDDEDDDPSETTTVKPGPQPAESPDEDEPEEDDGEGDEDDDLDDEEVDNG